MAQNLSWSSPQPHQQLSPIPKFSTTSLKCKVTSSLSTTLHQNIFSSSICKLNPPSLEVRVGTILGFSTMHFEILSFSSSQKKLTELFILMISPRTLLWGKIFSILLQLFLISNILNFVQEQKEGVILSNENMKEGFLEHATFEPSSDEIPSRGIASNFKTNHFKMCSFFWSLSPIPQIQVISLYTIPYPILIFTLNWRFRLKELTWLSFLDSYQDGVRGPSSPYSCHKKHGKSLLVLYFQLLPANCLCVIGYFGFCLAGIYCCFSHALDLD